MASLLQQSNKMNVEFVSLNVLSPNNKQGNFLLKNCFVREGWALKNVISIKNYIGILHHFANYFNGI